MRTGLPGVETNTAKVYVYTKQAVGYARLRFRRTSPGTVTASPTSSTSSRRAHLPPEVAPHAATGPPPGAPAPPDAVDSPRPTPGSSSISASAGSRPHLPPRLLSSPPSLGSRASGLPRSPHPRRPTHPLVIALQAPEAAPSCLRDRFSAPADSTHPGLSPPDRRGTVGFPTPSIHKQPRYSGELPEVHTRMPAIQ